jgi:hypothetical protein
MIEMIEPTTPATPAQPTQGVFMDNFQAPNLVGIIMQALEQHIEAMVDKRFNERMADLPTPNMDDIKDTITNMVDEKVSDMHSVIDDMIDEKISDHQSEYDHDEYDQCVRNVDDAGLDDLEDKIRDVLRNSSFTINL